MRNKKIKLHDQGRPVRNWLHADDTAAAIITVIESGKTNEIYNVAGGFEQTNIDTVKKIILEFYGTSKNWEKHIDMSTNRAGQDVRYALNDEKLRNLGWSPEKTFNQEIKKIVEHCKKNWRW